MPPYRRTHAHALAERSNKIANIASAVNGQQPAAPTPLPDRPHAKNKDVSPEARVEIAMTYFRYCAPGRRRVARNLMGDLRRDLEKHDVCHKTGPPPPNVHNVSSQLVWRTWCTPATLIGATHRATLATLIETKQRHIAHIGQRVVSISVANAP